uniref:Uncharacterized protein n=1 Tax=Salix viminalis TaxID=40686 RepID=A0A6N2KE36_SALVM
MAENGKRLASSNSVSHSFQGLIFVVEARDEFRRMLNEAIYRLNRMDLRDAVLLVLQASKQDLPNAAEITDN